MKFNLSSLSILLFTFLLVNSGCEKKLNELPLNSLSDETVFTTPERALAALNGVYDAAQSGVYPGGNRGYVFGAANVQQGDIRGEDMLNIAAFYEFTYQGTYNSGTLNNNNYFINLYRLINFANVAIEGFKKAGAAGIITPTLALQYEAECRFLRAIAHHELVIFFCRPFLDGNGDKTGLPYREVAINTGSLVDQARTIPRGTVAEVYTKLLADLDFAETNLPATLPAGQSSTIRPLRAAAIVAKMKARMHMGQWAQVRTEGNKLVPATVNPLAPTTVVSVIGAHSLTSTPNGSFASNSLSTENIWTIKNDPLDNPGANGALAAMYGSNDLLGRGLVAVSPIIWNNTGWRADDLRRTALYRNGTNANAVTAIMTTKYFDYVARGDNNPIYRWPEVLLMHAEAECRLTTGVSQRAIDLLNVVRNRSIPNPSANQYVATNFADQTELLNAILLERRIEFCAEGKRWSDIHRLVQDPITAVRPVGIPAKVASRAQAASFGLYGIGVPVTLGQPSIPYSDFRFIWPIPAEEVAQNPVITQNPGY